MTKGLEALKRIRQETCPSTYNVDFDKNDCCNIIEKELKVLWIIKEKRVDIFRITQCHNVHDYNECVYWNYTYLTKEEFDTLKRWIE